MWSQFTYDAAPMRVVFGDGRLAELPAEVERLGFGRVLVLTTPEQADLGERVSGLLGVRSAGVHPHARMHVPVEAAQAAAAAAREAGADGCVALGGGSSIGLGKAVALEHGLPIIAVPTTYAGSEMTQVWGLTENGVKRTGKNPVVRPRSVVYDPTLTLTLPVSMSVTSGMNALAHAVEGLYAPDATPIVSLMAREGASALVEALPAIAADGTDRAARSQALYGAWLCGAVLGATTMSLHHKLCHVLGGSFDLPHAAVHTVVLPHVLAFNALAAPQAVDVMGRTLGSPNPASALWQLVCDLGAPISLAEIGMAEDDLPAVAKAVLDLPYANPRAPTADDLAALLLRAQRGERPVGD